MIELLVFGILGGVVGSCVTYLVIDNMSVRFPKKLISPDILRMFERGDGEFILSFQFKKVLPPPPRIKRKLSIVRDIKKS